MEKILRFDDTKPYAFVSYKSQDRAVVAEDIAILQNKYGVNIWFDEELVAGRRWDEEVKPIVISGNCKLVIFYASPNALTSVNVQNEINLVGGLVKRKRKKLLPINFHAKLFMDVYYEEIDGNNEMLNANKNNPYFNQQGAFDLIESHLPDELTFIVRGMSGYYEAILKAIRADAPEIINKNIQVIDTIQQSQQGDEVRVVKTSERIFAGAEIPTDATAKASGKYHLTLKNNDVLQNLSMRGLVFSVIKDYVQNRPTANLEELQETFPLSIQKKIDIIINKEKIHELGAVKEKYYSVKTPLTLTNGTAILVSNQWHKGNIDEFIGCAQKLGYLIQAVD